MKRCRHSAPQASPRPKLATLNLDDRVSWAQQLEHNVAPVVLMSTFLVAPEDVDSFLDGFKKQFAIMRRQPGLISAQLHRGIAGSCLFMNYIVWESVDHFKRGFDLPEFQVQLKEYPASTVVSATFFQEWPYLGCASEKERPRRSDCGLRHTVVSDVAEFSLSETVV